MKNRNLKKQQQWFERKQKLNNEIVVKQQLLNTQLQAQQGLIPERERLNRLENILRDSF